MVSKNSAVASDLSAKLNQLEDKVSKLNAQIKENKQTIADLKLTIAQRDAHISELEAKLGYAQQSLLEKATQKIQECRDQIKTGLDENLIRPTVSQIQQQLKTAQVFVDETKTALLDKKAKLDRSILQAKDIVVHSPGQAKTYFEQSFITPVQAWLAQAQTTIEDNVLYPGKVKLDETVAVAQQLPDKVMGFIDLQIVGPINKASQQAAGLSKSLVPDTLAYFEKTTGILLGAVNRLQNDAVNKIKRSPFWNGKGRVGAGF